MGRAAKHAIPKVNNTNVDRSLDAIHATVFGCLRRVAASEPLFDCESKRTTAAHTEFSRQQAGGSAAPRRAAPPQGSGTALCSGLRLRSALSACSLAGESVSEAFSSFAGGARRMEQQIHARRHQVAPRG